jgi:streptomycin 6-kinase
MHEEPLPAMLFPSPSNELIQRASANAPRGQLWSWMQALPQTIQQCLSRWQIGWTGESLKQGYFGYVLPCRCQDGTQTILKLSPLAQEAQEQVIALSGWAGCGAALLSVRGSLPSGLQRLTAQLAANARHLHALKPLLRRYHDTMIALVDTIGRSQRPQQRSVLLHGDLHAGNLLLGSYGELLAIDPTPALGEAPCSYPSDQPPATLSHNIHLPVSSRPSSKREFGDPFDREVRLTRRP